MAPATYVGVLRKVISKTTLWQDCGQSKSKTDLVAYYIALFPKGYEPVLNNSVLDGFEHLLSASDYGDLEAATSIAAHPINIRPSNYKSSRRKQNLANGSAASGAASTAEPVQSRRHLLYSQLPQKQEQDERGKDPDQTPQSLMPMATPLSIIENNCPLKASSPFNERIFQYPALLPISPSHPSQHSTNSCADAANVPFASRSSTNSAGLEGGGDRGAGGVPRSPPLGSLARPPSTRSNEPALAAGSAAAVSVETGDRVAFTITCDLKSLRVCKVENSFSWPEEAVESHGGELSPSLGVLRKSYSGFFYRFEDRVLGMYMPNVDLDTSATSRLLKCSVMPKLACCASPKFRHTLFGNLSVWIDCWGSKIEAKAMSNGNTVRVTCGNVVLAEMKSFDGLSSKRCALKRKKMEVTINAEEIEKIAFEAFQKANSIPLNIDPKNSNGRNKFKAGQKNNSSKTKKKISALPGAGSPATAAAADAAERDVELGNPFDAGFNSQEIISPLPAEGGFSKHGLAKAYESNDSLIVDKAHVNGATLNCKPEELKHVVLALIFIVDHETAHWKQLRVAIIFLIAVTSIIGLLSLAFGFAEQSQNR